MVVGCDHGWGVRGGEKEKNGEIGKRRTGKRSAWGEKPKVNKENDKKFKKNGRKVRVIAECFCGGLCN